MSSRSQAFLEHQEEQCRFWDMFNPAVNATLFDLKDIRNMSQTGEDFSPAALDQLPNVPVAYLAVVYALVIFTCLCFWVPVWLRRLKLSCFGGRRQDEGPEPNKAQTDADPALLGEEDSAQERNDSAGTADNDRTWCQCVCSWLRVPFDVIRDLVEEAEAGPWAVMACCLLNILLFYGGSRGRMMRDCQQLSYMRMIRANHTVEPLWADATEYYRIVAFLQKQQNVMLGPMTASWLIAYDIVIVLIVVGTFAVKLLAIRFRLRKDDKRGLDDVEVEVQTRYMDVTRSLRHAVPVFVVQIALFVMMRSQYDQAFMKFLSESTYTVGHPIVSWGGAVIPLGKLGYCFIGLLIQFVMLQGSLGNSIFQQEEAWAYLYSWQQTGTVKVERRPEAVAHLRYFFLRLFMALVVDGGIFLHILGYTPIFLYACEEPTDFVKDALALGFLIELDDLGQPFYINMIMKTSSGRTSLASLLSDQAREDWNNNVVMKVEKCRECGESVCSCAAELAREAATVAREGSDAAADSVKVFVHGASKVAISAARSSEELARGGVNTAKVVYEHPEVAVEAIGALTSGISFNTLHLRKHGRA
eukprot:TRINITY_DN60160_c0_g1_i1.p1 TRINITY_DN60160_c0_g1~~TRINITY_DN60160_c0_g1_i1.p1  ORF type:complete len:586 (+),score=50.16 TRINITY_DN60160_c0_g1_i1:106-1863(+)